MFDCTCNTQNSLLEVTSDFSVASAQLPISRGANSIMLNLGFLGTQVGKSKPDIDTYGADPHSIQHVRSTNRSYPPTSLLTVTFHAHARKVCRYVMK